MLKGTNLQIELIRRKFGKTPAFSKIGKYLIQIFLHWFLLARNAQVIFGKPLLIKINNLEKQNHGYLINTWSKTLLRVPLYIAIFACRGSNLKLGSLSSYSLDILQNKLSYAQCKVILSSGLSGLK